MEQENNVPTGTEHAAQPHAPNGAAQKLDFAELLSDSWQLAQTKFWNLLGIYLIMMVITVVVLILAGVALGAIGYIISLAQLPALLVLYIGLAIIALIVLLLWVSAWEVIASYRFLDNGGSSTVKDIVTDAKPHAWSLVPTMAVGTLAVIGGFFAFVIPGIIMGVSLSFIFTVAVLENKKMWPALVRSRDLVRGRWWNLFIIFVAFVIFSGIVIAATGLSYSPLLVLLYPFCYILSYVIYKKLSNLPAAAVPTARGDWYYKLAAGFGILVIAAGILGATYAAGKDWDKFKAGFNEGMKDGKGDHDGYYDDTKYDNMRNKKYDKMPIEGIMKDVEMMEMQ